MKKILLSLALVAGLLTTTAQEVKALKLPTKKSITVAIASPVILTASIAAATYYVGKNPELIKYYAEIVQLIASRFANSIDANITHENATKLTMSFLGIAGAQYAKLSGLVSHMRNSSLSYVSDRRTHAALLFGAGSICLTLAMNAIIN